MTSESVAITVLAGGLFGLLWIAWVQAAAFNLMRKSINELYERDRKNQDAMRKTLEIVTDITALAQKFCSEIPSLQTRVDELFGHVKLLDLKGYLTQKAAVLKARFPDNEPS